MYSPTTIISVQVWISKLKDEYPVLIGETDALENGIDAMAKRILYLEDKLVKEDKHEKFKKEQIPGF